MSVGFSMRMKDAGTLRVTRVEFVLRYISVENLGAFRSFERFAFEACTM